MTRDLDALTRDPLDLLVVGGGVHGLFAAYDAAQRGLRVGLVEAADFGGGLSFNHQRTLHGGLRELERGRLLKARRQIHERRTWAHIAPHLVRPLPFLVGTYRFTKRSPLVLRAGFRAYDLLGRGRNTGVSPELHLPRARLESAAATRRLFPGIDGQRLAGGAVWYDYQAKHPDRLTWTVALAARDAGAVLANHARAVAPLREGAAVAGARVRDELTGRELDVPARVTLLAAGSALGPLLEAFGASGAPPLLRAMNLLVDRPARDIATAARGPSGRTLTAVPWRGFVLVGTHQSTAFVGPDEPRPPIEAVEAFLSDIQATFRALDVQATDVRLVHHGLVPATTRRGRAELLADTRIIRHARQGTRGLVSLVGVKYTNARTAAEAAVNAVLAELGRHAGRCRTASVPLPYAGIADGEGRLTEALREHRLDLDRDVREHLTSWYSTEAVAVVTHAIERQALDRLTDDQPYLTGEFSYAAEHASARTLTDAVLRRTPLGSAGHPGRAALERAAAAMAGPLGWSAEDVAREIAEIERIYPPNDALTGRRTL
ncbi:MAG: FAD-dependent oxidoreductase [Vicinamibacterales bacterium]